MFWWPGVLGSDMEETMRPKGQRLGRYMIVATVAWTVTAPLLALAYFATADGREQLDVSTVSAWAVPARDVLEPLLTFASPDRVYVTYVFVLATLFPAVFLSARAARADRPADLERGERWAWRLTLIGYGLFGAGLVALALVMLVVGPGPAYVNAMFLAVAVPGLLLSLIGSTSLGTSMLRGRYAPKATGWLLALSLPFWLVVGTALGHNSIGLYPLAVAWAIASSPRGEISDGWTQPGATGRRSTRVGAT